VVNSNYILLTDVQPVISIILINADACNFSTSSPEWPAYVLHIDFRMLSSPVIPGSDFLSKHGTLLDFWFHCKKSCAQPERLNMVTECISMLVLDNDLPQVVPCSIQQSSEVDAGMPKN